MTRILHSIDVYLRVSENWVYPQIHRVPGVTPAVMCGETENIAQFPLRGAPVIVNPPPWSRGLGLPRLANSLAFRAGHPLLAATAEARRWKPDLLHAHFGMAGWALLPMQRRLGVPLITSFYGVDAWSLPVQTPVWRERYKELFANGTAFIAEGPAMGERLKAIGCDADKIHVVRIGVDPAELAPVDRDMAPVLRLFMIARFTEKKGLPDGLRACLEARRLGVDCTMTIVGDGIPGHEDGLRIKAELNEIAAAPELQGRVHFTRFQPAAKSRGLMRGHDIYICPSKHAHDSDAEGGSPVSLTEAMAMGLLCIGTRHCDIPEVIHHGETGLLADSGDAQGLAALIARVAGTRDEARAMCRRGRTHIETHFSTAAQVGALRKIYTGLLGRPDGDATPC